MRLPDTGAKATLSRSSRMSSTELFDAASISITSSELARAMAMHESHVPHGCTVGPCSQFKQAARIFAIDVSARPARAHEQVGVMHLIALHGVAERAHDRLLPDDLLERARPVPAIQGRGLLLCLGLVWHAPLSLLAANSCPVPPREAPPARAAGSSG